MENKPKLDIVDRAEKAIQSLKRTDIHKGNKIGLNPTKIRKFLTAVTSIKNKVEIVAAGQGSAFKELPDDLALEVKLLKMNILYQAGRDSDIYIEDFIQKSGIVTFIESIGNDYKKFQQFCRYVEALIAFHKYYSSQDKQR